MARKTAAFYDLDGTILHGSVVDHYLYFAKTDPSLPGRVRRLAETLVKAPYYKYIDYLDRLQFNHEFYASYAGLSEDRLAILGEALFEKVLRKKIYGGMLELLKRDRQAGHHQVLLTGALDFVAQPVARYLGIKKVVANRLEYEVNGLCTGVLRPPVMAGPEKANWMREYAHEHGYDLRWSVAYADDAADLPMLSMVGRPVAVNPDARLLATARSHGWPVIHIEVSKSWTRDAAREAIELGKEGARRVREETQRRGPVVARRTLGLLGDVASGVRTWARGNE
ncbi:MAG: HAD-IB family hydrolase [Planctomycetes bacterium]|nr:HAD-IB family hydrolase [Planctomycetota bacterium]